jgi:hypothetical protein
MKLLISCRKIRIYYFFYQIHLLINMSHEAILLMFHESVSKICLSNCLGGILTNSVPVPLKLKSYHQHIRIRRRCLRDSVSAFLIIGSMHITLPKFHYSQKLVGVFDSFILKFPTSPGKKKINLMFTVCNISSV